MADGPLSCWPGLEADGAPDQPAVDDPFAPVNQRRTVAWPTLPDGLDWFGPIYRAMALRWGWDPRTVDRLEVWEAAVLLGHAGVGPAVQQVQAVTVSDGYDPADG